MGRSLVGQIIENVIPAGSPWGGPESVRYLACLTSLLMHMDGERGEPADLHSRHEELYRLLLTVSGIGVSTMRSAIMAPTPHDAMVDGLFPDAIARTMARAGFHWAETAFGRVQIDAVRARVVDSIKRNVPVLATSPDAGWRIVTGYRDAGRTLIGWDGAQTYWGPPAYPADEYLEDGRFAAANWPAILSRFLFVEDRIAPEAGSRSVIARLVVTMESQRRAGHDREFRGLLADDRWRREASDEEIRRLHDHANAFFGWHAESRCFVASALDDTLSTMPDVRANRTAVHRLRRAAGYFMDTHDTCWEGWRSLLVRHRCAITDAAPCRQCGGCLRPATDEDRSALRSPKRRRKVEELLDIVDRNDARALEQFRRCLDAL